MFTLQQFEEAEERVHAWHEDMQHCMEAEHAQQGIARRSWIAALGHCLGYLGGWSYGSRDEEAAATASPIRASR